VCGLASIAWGRQEMLTVLPACTHHQVAKANEYVNQGNKALTSAKALQKDTRKWMCCAVMILLGICLIVVLAVVKPWQARGMCNGRRGRGWRRARVQSERRTIVIRSDTMPAALRSLQNGIA
jgi:hypothetical protein